MGEMAVRLDRAGADGLVLFNRFLQPDIDPETLRVVPAMRLSDPSEGRLARTWISLLHGRVEASLAATTGVENVDNVVAYLLAGADVVMTTSALLRHGPYHSRTLLDGLADWMRRKGFDTVQEIRGLLAAPADADHTESERSSYVSAMRRANTGAFGVWSDDYR
jgi:dihydroorotate dehydrogenase (fumarate)